MAMKQPQKKVYTSMRGKRVDLDLLRKRNELTPAVGNARVNARGDELGPGGKIIRSKENIVKDYYQSQNAVPEPIKKSKIEETPAVEEEAKPATRTSRRRKQEVDDWVEDDNGNFVKGD